MIKKYCRGSKENPQGVITALKQLGGKNPNRTHGEKEDFVYYIDKYNNIICACNSHKDVIEECFEEIQPVSMLDLSRFKEGDIVTIVLNNGPVTGSLTKKENDKLYLVYPMFQNSNDNSCYISQYFYLDEINRISPAKLETVDKYKDYLHTKGQYYSATDKQIYDLPDRVTLSTLYENTNLWAIHYDFLKECFVVWKHNFPTLKTRKFPNFILQLTELGRVFREEGTANKYCKEMNAKVTSVLSK